MFSNANQGETVTDDNRSKSADIMYFVILFYRPDLCSMSLDFSLKGPLTYLEVAYGKT